MAFFYRQARAKLPSWALLKCGVLGVPVLFKRAFPDLLIPSCHWVRLPLGRQASCGAGCLRPPISPASPALPKSPALIAVFSCTTERKEEKTPTYVVPTRDSDMLTSLLYPVSNLNTEGALGRSRKPASNGSLWAGSFPPPGHYRQNPAWLGWLPQIHCPSDPLFQVHWHFATKPSEDALPALTSAGPWERTSGFSLAVFASLGVGVGGAEGVVADPWKSQITEG